jgi:HSP20 family molecular chaperone IbpA
MAQQSSWFDIPMRPALPPPPATADLYETAGGEAYVVKMHVPGVEPEEIVVEATPDSLRVLRTHHKKKILVGTTSGTSKRSVRGPDCSSYRWI